MGGFILTLCLLLCVTNATGSYFGFFKGTCPWPIKLGENILIFWS